MMSADNWGVCPRCHKNREAKLKVEYGKVSEADYRASLNKQSEPEEKTLREDWEIGADKNGLFEISYGCFCATCGFKYDFLQKKQLDIA